MHDDWRMYARDFDEYDDLWRDLLPPVAERYANAEWLMRFAQCFQDIARRLKAGNFGGDVNRQGSCAPRGMWVTRDTSASQTAGVQHIYGDASVTPLSASVAEAASVMPPPARSKSLMRMPGSSG